MTTAPGMTEEEIAEAEKCANELLANAEQLERSIDKRAIVLRALVVARALPRLLSSLKHTKEEMERVREGLAIKELREHWSAFADADPIPDFDGFTDRMEAAGLIALRGVTARDLETSFAAERGIEKGGMVWDLTDKGRSLLHPTGESNDR